MYPLYRTYRFKNKNDAKTFDYLLKSSNFNYSVINVRRNDRKGTKIYVFTVKVEDNCK